MFRRTAVGHQSITIGNNIVLAVMGITNGRIRIAVDAPEHVRVIGRSAGRSECVQPEPVSPQEATPASG